MRKIILLLFFLSFQSHAGIEVDRIWSEGNFGYALVTYANTTGKTFNTAVTIKCVAMGKNKKKLGVNEGSLFTHQHGPIKPGFSDTVEIPFQLNGAKMKSVRCSYSEN